MHFTCLSISSWCILWSLSGFSTRPTQSSSPSERETSPENIQQRCFWDVHILNQAWSSPSPSSSRPPASASGSLLHPSCPPGSSQGWKTTYCQLWCESQKRIMRSSELFLSLQTRKIFFQPCRLPCLLISSSSSSLCLLTDMQHPIASLWIFLS